MFSSFFLAGFECATGFNSRGEWIDQIAATRHDAQIDEDYRLLRQVGIRAAREGVRWPIVQRGAQYDFSSLDLVLKAARKHGIEIIYDLFHFGYPPALDIFSREFGERFADYCRAVALRVFRESDGPYCFTPVNEPSYFAWAASEAGLFAPYLKQRGPQLKVALAAAAIQAAHAIRDVCPGARFVSVDPICRVVAPPDRPDLEAEAARFNNSIVFESWDMLAGRLHPELGGSPEILDVVGVNYYWTNQWVIDRPGLPLEEDDPHYIAPGELIASVARRYGNEILLTETSHAGPQRGPWLDCISGEAELLLSRHIPLRGVCLYPILGMPEWHDRSVWTRMGLWDLVRSNGHLARICHEPMLHALRQAQQRLEKRRTDLASGEK